MRKYPGLAPAILAASALASTCSLSSSEQFCLSGTDGSLPKDVVVATVKVGNNSNYLAVSAHGDQLYVTSLTSL